MSCENWNAHLDWIIQQLKDKPPGTFYLEKEWFDENVSIDLDMALAMKGKISSEQQSKSS